MESRVEEVTASYAEATKEAVELASMRDMRTEFADLRTKWTDGLLADGVHLSPAGNTALFDIVSRFIGQRRYWRLGWRDWE